MLCVYVADYQFFKYKNSSSIINLMSTFVEVENNLSSERGSAI